MAHIADSNPGAGIETGSLDPKARGHLVNALVVPRPIGWISTVDSKGVPNLAPHSYFNLVSMDPPIVSVASTGIKDTIRNIVDTKEFVVNLVSVPLADQMVLTSARVAADVDEFVLADIEACTSNLVSPPRVAKTPAALECRLVNVLEIGDARVAFGEVMSIYIDPAVMTGDRVDSEKLQPVARLGGAWYATLGRTFQMRRPADVTDH